MRTDELSDNRTVHANVEPLRGKYRVTSNQYIPCDWCTIFNTRQFFELHSTANSFYFQLVSVDPTQVLGVTHFTEVAPGHYRSPRRGTFGSFEVRRTLRIEVMESFVDDVEHLIAASGAQTIEILEPPAIFHPAQAAMLYNILCRRGYVVQAADLDYSLVVDGRAISDRIEPSRRQRISKCKRDGIIARHVDLSLCRKVYEVISHNRAAKGIPLTMTCEGIAKMLEVFPDRMVFFGAFAGDKLIASSICIKVSRAVLYVFYWGDLPGYEKFSPITLLAECIYDYAQKNTFSLMDLGTGTEHGVPIYGLINFKRELGCVESLKLSYVKQLK